jgi:cbb3-type cytochrome oxidase maturation protein
VNILYLLIPLGLILVVIMVAAFFWAAKAGQFDDLQTPAVQILLDDDSKSVRQDRKVRDA